MRIPRARSIATAPFESLTDVPTMVSWLAMLIIAGSLAAASVNVLPYWPIEHKSVDWLIAAVMLAVGVVMWLGRERVPHWVIHVGLIVGVSCITWSGWAAGPTAESPAAALFYGFLSAVASAFLVRRQAIAYVTFAGALYLGAMLSHWREEMIT